MRAALTGVDLGRNVPRVMPQILIDVVGTLGAAYLKVMAIQLSAVAPRSCCPTAFDRFYLILAPPPHESAGKIAEAPRSHIDRLYAAAQCAPPLQRRLRRCFVVTKQTQTHDR